MTQDEKIVELAPAKNDHIVHTVRSGETLSSIAKKYGVTAQDLQAWNNNGNKRIYVGQRLNVKNAIERDER